jgi:NAD(P)-dependent dehydrogenase (short-subunit alcohol dehydrogenase family)
MMMQVIDAQGAPHSADLWDFALAVNLSGTFHLARLALPHMIKNSGSGPDAERGVLVFASSAAAVRALPALPPVLLR